MSLYVTMRQLDSCAVAIKFNKFCLIFTAKLYATLLTNQWPQLSVCCQSMRTDFTPFCGRWLSRKNMQILMEEKLSVLKGKKSRFRFLTILVENHDFRFDLIYRNSTTCTGIIWIVIELHMAVLLRYAANFISRALEYKKMVDAWVCQFVAITAQNIPIMESEFLPYPVWFKIKCESLLLALNRF